MSTVTPPRAPTGAAPDPAPTRRLTSGARRRRVAVTLAVAALLTAGTFRGEDDDFPFGPFRMYSTSTAPSGAVVTLAVQARLDGRWTPVPLTPGNVGVNRAEAEGQAGRMIADPRLLGMLAEAHSRLKPDAAPWDELRLVREAAVLRDRRPTGEIRRETLVVWTRP